MKLVHGRTLAALLAEQLVPSARPPAFPGGLRAGLLRRSPTRRLRRVIPPRDLKPANVMVGAFGEVQVMDWGLAKVLPDGGVADERKRPDVAGAVTQVRTLRTDGSGSESQVGSVLGTPAYMRARAGKRRGEIDRVDRAGRRALVWVRSSARS